MRGDSLAMLKNSVDVNDLESKAIREQQRHSLIKKES